MRGWANSSHIFDIIAYQSGTVRMFDPRSRYVFYVGSPIIYILISFTVATNVPVLE
jgi:hypothetical protein